MSRHDRQFAEARAVAMRSPLTRASRLVAPMIEMSGNIHIALSVNK